MSASSIGLNLEQGGTSHLPPFAVSIGIEGTFEPFTQRDTLTATRHFRTGRWSDDFALVRELGLSEFRYPIPWHRVEKHPGVYEWRQLDRVIHAAQQQHGLTIIADTLHHTSRMDA